MSYIDRVVAITGTDIPGSILPPVCHDMTSMKVLNSLVKEEDPERFQQMYHMLQGVARISRPSDAHKALADYGVPIITTCADGLHQKAGSDDENVIELCGNVLKGNLRLYGEPLKNRVKAWDLINMAPNNSLQCLLIIGLRDVEWNELEEPIHSAVDKGYYCYQMLKPGEHEVRDFLEELNKA